MKALLLALAITGAQPATADHVEQLVSEAAPAAVHSPDPASPASGSGHSTSNPGPLFHAQTLPPQQAEDQVRADVHDALIDLGRGDEFACIAGIFTAESSWQPDAVGDRDRGGSYGLPQRHAPVWGTPPDPWPIKDQVAWTVEYADDRYGGLCDAWASHQRKGWW